MDVDDDRLDLVVNPQKKRCARCEIAPRHVTKTGKVCSYCSACQVAINYAALAKRGLRPPEKKRLADKTICPLCKTLRKVVFPSGRRGSYCRPCQAARTAARRVTKGRTKVPYDPTIYRSTTNWKTLGIADRETPSNSELCAWTGWQIDRHASRSYAYNQLFDDPLDQLYFMGHLAIVRFWRSMNGTGWEMGPDSGLVVDGQETGRSLRFRLRSLGKRPTNKPLRKVE